MTSEMTKRAQAAAATAQTLALIAFWVIAATLIASYAAMAYRIWVAEGVLGDRLRELAPPLLRLLPAIYFLSALTFLRRALREYESGAFFSPKAANAVRRAGEEALIALATQIIIAPSIISWIGGRAFDFEFEVVDLALAAFVLFVAAIGRVLDLAVAIKAENDEII